jgi:hypothetical protein
MAMSARSIHGIDTVAYGGEDQRCPVDVLGIGAVRWIQFGRDGKTT